MERAHEVIVALLLVFNFAPVWLQLAFTIYNLTIYHFGFGYRKIKEIKC